MNNLSIKSKEQLSKIYDFFKINPHKHWKFLVYIFFILIIVLILFSFYLLYQIRKEQIFQVTVNTQVQKTILKEKLLKNVTDFYEIKAQKEATINSGGVIYTDPSL